MSAAVQQSAPAAASTFLASLAALALLTFLALMLSALLERSGPIRIRHWTENAGERLRRLYAERSRFEAFRFLLSTLARLLPVLFVVLAWRRGAFEWWQPFAAVAVLVVVTDAWARYLVRRHAERALQLSSPAYRALSWLMGPFLLVLGPLFGGEEPPRSDEEEDDDASDDEIDAFIDVGRREGILEPEEEALVRSVVDFGDTQVRSIMTPRVEINSAPSDIDAEDLAAKFFDCKNSRMPIYEGSIDRVEGVLHIRDLFAALHCGQPVKSVLDLCQQPLYVPESKPLPDLLAELQHRHQQMAIVVDEYGGIAGLVTVEDLVEEIVGEIRDEHEDQTEPEALGDGAWRLAGRANLEDFEALTGVDMAADDLPYETLSGLICGELGYVPKSGEALEWEGLELRVDEADERRVVRVTVQHPREEP
ncbi:MAG: hemolysin family protein [Acidobacteriota bacterium]